MRRAILLILLLVIAAPSWAQRTTPIQTAPQKTVLDTMTGNATQEFLVEPGIVNHQLTIMSTSGITGMTITWTANTDGGTAYPNTLGTSTTLGTVTLTATGSYKRMKVAISGSSGTGQITGTYLGNISVAGGGTSSDGTGVDTYITYWNSQFQIGGDSGFRYNQTPTAPTISIVESDQAANGKWWAFGINGGVSTRSLCSDLGASCIAYETITRSGTSVATYATSAAAYSFLSGTATFANTVTGLGFATLSGVASAGTPFSSIAATSDDITSLTLQLYNNENTSTANANIRIGNANADANSTTRITTYGTAFTTSGTTIQDGGALFTGSALSGGLVVGTKANAALSLFTNDTLRLALSGDGTTVLPSTTNATRLGNSSFLWSAVNATVYESGASTGTSVTLSCSAGQAVKTLTTVGGIVTAATCGAP